MKPVLAEKDVLPNNEKFGEFTELSPQLSFICTVRRNQVTARVIGYLKHPAHIVYRIGFSDGYVSDFDNARGHWVDAATGQTGKISPYAFAIKDDLGAISGFEHCKEYYSFRTKVEEEEENVFVLLKEHEGMEMYDVLYGGFYHFSLIKVDDEWQYGNVYHRDEPVNEVLARNVSLVLETNH